MTSEEQLETCKRCHARQEKRLDTAHDRTCKVLDLLGQATQTIAMMQRILMENHEALTKHGNLSILDLEGMGAEIWKDIDPREFTREVWGDPNPDPRP